MRVIRNVVFVCFYQSGDEGVSGRHWMGDQWSTHNSQPLPMGKHKHLYFHPYIILQYIYWLFLCGVHFGNNRIRLDCFKVFNIFRLFEIQHRQLFALESKGCLLRSARCEVSGDEMTQCKKTTTFSSSLKAWKLWSSFWKVAMWWCCLINGELGRFQEILTELMKTYASK